MSVLVIGIKSKKVFADCSTLDEAFKERDRIEFDGLGELTLVVDGPDKLARVFQLRGLEDWYSTLKREITSFKDNDEAAMALWRELQNGKTIDKENFEMARKAMDRNVVVLNLGENKEPKFQKDSVRAKCYALIKDGMTMQEYITTAGKAKINKAVALGCLQKLKVLKAVQW